MGARVITPKAADRIATCHPPTALEQGYLLIDPGAFPDADQVDSLLPRICKPTNWSRDLAGLPAIVDLARCDAGQREWLASVMSEEHESRKRLPLFRPGVCAYIVAPVEANDLANHVADQLLVLPVDKSGNRSLSGALWRFFDPRVFANLCWMLEPEQLASLVGAASRWSYPWLDEWFEFSTGSDRPAENAQDRAHERVAGLARIDIGLWERAQRIATINQVLARLNLPPELTWHQIVSVATRIEEALVVARLRLHWDSEEDQVLYAQHVARYGPAFQAHVRLVECWAQLETRSAAMSCADVIALLTPEESAALVQHAIDPAQAITEIDTPDNKLIRGT
jgi:hypothetical protein